MKIISLEAEGFKRLRAVSITPTSNVVEISGENGNGKSSVLDAIWAALGGKDACPAKPIHTGEQTAEVRLLLGEGGEPRYKITRRFKLKEGVPYATDLKVELADGPGSLSGGQGLLDKFVGDLCFDPLAFTRLDDKGQITLCRRFVPEVDFAEVERLNKADYDERTEVNRRAKDLRSQAQALPEVAGDIPQLVDLAALETELAQVGQRNGEIAARKARRDAAQARLRELGEQIARLQAEEKALAEQIAGADELPEPVDAEAIRVKLAEGRQANDLTERATRRRELEMKAKDAEEQSMLLTTKIETRTAGAAKAVQAAKMPIAGLGFGDGFVTLNGEPFAQASTAEKIRASVAIAAAMNPKLRVARIADGSLLDKKSWAALAEYAEANDLQIWVETVDAKGSAAIIIEDGGIAGATKQTPVADVDDVI